MTQVPTSKYFLLFVAILCFGFIGTIQAQSRLLGLSFWQGKQETKIDKPFKTIELKKETFTLMFNTLPLKSDAKHCTLIAAYQDEKSLQLIHPGVRINDIPFFAPGTGSISALKGYNSLIIDTFHNHHHYIFYEAPDSRRAKLEKWHGDTVRVSWKIPKIGPAGSETSISNTDIQSFYLIMINDYDLNGIIDEGEYCVVKVVFKY